MKSKIMPPSYFLISLALTIGINFILPIKKIIPFPYTYVGALFILFGIIINIWTDNLFKKSKTTVKPYETPISFEVSGPFSISRHPMYLGMCAILTGVAIILGSISTFVFPIIFIILMEIMFIPFEERNLEQEFGEKYLDYKKKVRRWF